MKTIMELKNEGLISTRLYRSLVRGISFDNKFIVKGNFRWEIDRPNANELTVKDIFDLWSEEEILKWRGLGQSCLSELKSLI